MTVGVLFLEQWDILMEIRKYKGTITTKGIKPSQETHDTEIQSSPYKLGVTAKGLNSNSRHTKMIS